MITLILRHRFVFAPVLLSSVTRHFSGLEHTFRFYELVREYLPEERERLLKMEPPDTARDFARLFSKRYFPLHINASDYQNSWGRENVLSDLTHSIPLERHGLEQYRYEPSYYTLPHSQLLAETVCVCPFECYSRLPVIEQLKKKLGDEALPLLKLLPAKGFKIDHVEEALQDSPYPGFLAWCRWIFARTGNVWLDTTLLSTEWSRETVEQLAREYPGYLEVDKQMKDFDKWLTGKLAEHSAEVIRYLARKIKNRPKALFEVLSGGENGHQDESRLALTV